MVVKVKGYCVKPHTRKRPTKKSIAAKKTIILYSQADRNIIFDAFRNTGVEVNTGLKIFKKLKKNELTSNDKMFILKVFKKYRKDFDLPKTRRNQISITSKKLK